MRHLLLALLFVLSVPRLLLAQQTQEQLASYHFSRGEYAEAVELYEALYSRSGNKFYYQMLTRSYVELGEYRKAESLISGRIKKYPRDLTLHVDMSELHNRKGDRKKARRACDEALELIGVDSRQTADLVIAYEAAGLLDYAVRAYLRLRDNTHNRYLFVTELAALYGRQGDYASMMREYFDLLDHSPQSIESIQISLQRMLREGAEPRVAEALRSTLVERVQTQPDNVQNIDMMIWFSLQQKDFAFALAQAKALDRRFGGRHGESVWRVAQVARANEAYDVARDGYAYLVNKGSQHPYYMESRVGELQLQFQQLVLDHQADGAALKTLQERYESALAELGSTLSTVPLLRDYATLLAYHRHDLQAASDVLYDILEMDKLPPRVRDEVKLELGDLMLVAGEVWDASLLYMQVEKSNKEDLLGSVAKFRNAKLSYYNHDFEWAKSQLDVLRSSTSKLVANDAMELSLLISDNMEQDSTFDMLDIFADADLLLYRNQLDAAWLRFDEISRRSLSHPLLDDVLMRKAQICIKQGRYADADTLLGQLYAFYPDGMLADDALFLRAGICEQHLQQDERARSFYELLLTDYPASIYTEQARKRYNEIKNR